MTNSAHTRAQTQIFRKVPQTHTHRQEILAILSTRVITLNSFLPLLSYESEQYSRMNESCENELTKVPIPHCLLQSGQAAITCLLDLNRHVRKEMFGHFLCSQWFQPFCQTHFFFFPFVPSLQSMLLLHRNLLNRFHKIHLHNKPASI